MLADLTTDGKCYIDDPNVFGDVNFDTVSEVMMGDIVQSDDAEITLALEVSSLSLIERVEVRNGIEVVETLRGFSEKELGERIRVVWSGAECRGPRP